MAGFHEVQLEPRITLGAFTTKVWNRTFTETIGGAFKQKFNRSYRLKKMQLEYRPRPLSEYETLSDLFDVVLGNQKIGFRAKDWGDFALTQANSSLTLVSGSDWQVCRKHTSGALTYLHPIKKPVLDSLVIWRNGLAEATATIDYTTGIATISGHSEGDTYTAVGEFDIPVTFETDEWLTNLMVSTENLWLKPDSVVLREISPSQL